MLHQDCYNKHYTINYYHDYIDIEINFIPEDKFNKSKIYFDLVVFYKIDDTIIKYNGKIFYNEEDFKNFFKCINQNIFYSHQNIHLNTSNHKNIKYFNKITALNFTIGS